MVKLIAQSEGKTYDITHRSGNITRSDNIDGLAQELNFDYFYNRHDKYSRDMHLELGEAIHLADEKDKIMEATVISFQDNFNGTISYTAFDHGHILSKNQCVIQFNDMKTSDAVIHLCKCHGITAECCKIEYKLTKNYFGETLAEAIKDMLGMATFATGTKYRMEVRGQKLVVEEYKDMEVELVGRSATNTGIFNPLEAPSSMSASGSTESMFNYVKVIDNDGKLISMAKDDKSIKRFGRYHKVETSDNLVADSILEKVKDPEITLSMTLFGDDKCRSGRILTIEKKKYIVVNCTHTYTGNNHMMQVELKDAAKVDAAVQEVNPNEGGESGDGTPNNDMQAINKMLGKKDGVFKNKGPLIVKLAEKYGIPPTLAVAIICSETGYGTAVYHNNPAGIMDPASNWTRLKHYNSLDQGLEDAIKNMSNIWKRGGKTIAGLGAIYCPVGAPNDPGGLNKNWVPSVTSMVNEMGGLYTKPKMIGGQGNGIATGQWMDPTKGAGTRTQMAHFANNAIDIGAPPGTPLYAADGGVVEHVQYFPWKTDALDYTSYGNCVVINHGNGWKTRYAHMLKAEAKQGQKVSKGQKIGMMGDTGNSHGSHIHFEMIYNGVGRYPGPYIGR